MVFLMSGHFQKAFALNYHWSQASGFALVNCARKVICPAYYVCLGFWACFLYTTIVDSKIMILPFSFQQEQRQNSLWEDRSINFIPVWDANAMGNWSFLVGQCSHCGLWNTRQRFAVYLNKCPYPCEFSCSPAPANHSSGTARMLVEEKFISFFVCLLWFSAHKNKSCGLGQPSAFLPPSLSLSNFLSHSLHLCFFYLFLTLIPAFPPYFLNNSLFFLLLCLCSSFPLSLSLSLSFFLFWLLSLCVSVSLLAEGLNVSYSLSYWPVVAIWCSFHTTPNLIRELIAARKSP